MIMTVPAAGFVRRHPTLHITTSDLPYIEPASAVLPTPMSRSATGPPDALAIRQQNIRIVQAAALLRHAQSQDALRQAPAPFTPISAPARYATAVNDPETRLHPASKLENLPLPWSATPIGDLGGVIVAELVADTMTDLTLEPIRMFTPRLLRTSHHERRRLETERHRLLRKYSEQLHVRDGILEQLRATPDGDHPGLGRVVASLSKAIERCDRLVRQIYICNDQVRQIEVQQCDHTIGALRMEIESKLAEASQRSPSAMSDYSSYSPVTDDFEMEAIPLRETATKMVQSANLGFPVPPPRDEADEPSLTVEVASRPTSEMTIRSADTLRIERIQRSTTHQFHPRTSSLWVPPVSIGGSILIFPPAHHRSSSDPVAQQPLQHTISQRESGSLAYSSSSTAPLRINMQLGQIVRSRTIPSEPRSEHGGRSRTGRESQLETVSQRKSLS